MKTAEEIKRENPEPDMDGTCGRIQYGGTDVCIDLYCECGAHHHFDGEFLFHFKCGECGQVYQVGKYVKLYPLDFEPEEIYTLKNTYSD